MAGGPLGGLVTPPEYMQSTREICDRHDVLLIADEVVSGIGRTGKKFGVEHSGVTPDVITVAKGLERNDFSVSRFKIPLGFKI